MIFQVILHIHPEFIEEPAGGVNGGVNDLLNLIAEYPGNRAPFFVEQMNVPLRSIERWVQLLRDEKKIEYRCAPKTGGYWKTE